MGGSKALLRAMAMRSQVWGWLGCGADWGGSRVVCAAGSGRAEGLGLAVGTPQV